MRTTDVAASTSHADIWADSANPGAPYAQVLLTRVATGDAVTFYQLYR